MERKRLNYVFQYVLVLQCSPCCWDILVGHRYSRVCWALVFDAKDSLLEIKNIKPIAMASHMNTTMCEDVLFHRLPSLWAGLPNIGAPSSAHTQIHMEYMGCSPTTTTWHLFLHLVSHSGWPDTVHSLINFLFGNTLTLTTIYTCKILSLGLGYMMLSILILQQQPHGTDALSMSMWQYWL